MEKVIDDMAAGNFPDQEAPDLQIIFPLLGKAYMERSKSLEGYGFSYLEKVNQN